MNALLSFLPFLLQLLASLVFVHPAMPLQNVRGIGGFLGDTVWKILGLPRPVDGYFAFVKAFLAKFNVVNLTDSASCRAFVQKLIAELRTISDKGAIKLADPLLDQAAAAIANDAVWNAIWGQLSPILTGQIAEVSFAAGSPARLAIEAAAPVGAFDWTTLWPLIQQIIQVVIALFHHTTPPAPAPLPSPAPAPIAE
jgi:hypothetical protein